MLTTSSRRSISLTQETWKMLTNDWKFPNRNVQTFGFVYHDTNGKNHGPVWKTQLFLLSGICMVILWHDCCGKGNLRKLHWNTVGKKVPNWECFFVHREKRLFLSVYVDDIKLAGKKQHIDPMWKVLNKEVDLGEPTSFLDHVYLGCTQRQCEVSQDIVDNYRTMFEIESFSGGLEKLPFSQNNRISSWSYDMAGHAKKCVERYCELANKTTQQLYKVSTPCIDDHHNKEEEMKSVENCHKYAPKLFWNVLYTARIGRPDIPWSVNNLARSITKWTKACDKRLNRLISYVHHTCEYKQYCHVGNTAKQCRLGLFQDSDLQEILRIQNPLREEHCAFLEVIRLFQSVGCVRTNFSFTQLHRSGNHFLGRRIKVGRYTRAWFMGSDRRSSSRKHVSE